MKKIDYQYWDERLRYLKQETNRKVVSIYSLRELKIIKEIRTLNLDKKNTL